MFYFETFSTLFVVYFDLGCPGTFESPGKEVRTLLFLVRAITLTYTSGKSGVRGVYVSSIRPGVSVAGHSCVIYLLEELKTCKHAEGGVQERGLFGHQGQRGVR